MASLEHCLELYGDLFTEEEKSALRAESRALALKEKIPREQAAARAVEARGDEVQKEYDKIEKVIEKHLKVEKVVPEKTAPPEKVIPEKVVPSEKAVPEVVELIKEPLKPSNLADISASHIQAKKQVDGKYKFIFVGTNNKVLKGEKFKIEGEFELTGVSSVGVSRFSEVVKGKVQEKQYTLFEFKKKWLDEQIKKPTVPVKKPKLLKSTDSIGDTTLGEFVAVASRDPAQALKHIARATVSRELLREGLVNKGLAALGEVSKSERPEMRKNLEAVLKELEITPKAEPTIKEAQAIISAGYLPPLHKSLLKSAIERAEKGDFTDLYERFPRIKKIHEKGKKEIEERDREEAEREALAIKHISEGKTKEVLQKELAKVEKEQIQLYRRRDRLRPDDRTARKAHLENKLDENARKIGLLKRAIEKTVVKEEVVSYTTGIKEAEAAFGSEEKRNEAIESVAKKVDSVSRKRVPDRERIVESKIAKELRTKRRVDLTGRKLTKGKEGQEIAELFQVYRSPKMEILHTIYTAEDGTILGHNAMTSGEIDVVAPKDIARYMYRMESARRRLGAVKVHILHNHPSGDATMSQADVNFAHKLARYFDRPVHGRSMGEFIVIDHGRYSRVSEYRPDSASTVEGSFKIIPGTGEWMTRKGPALSRPETVASFGKSLAYDKTKACFIYVDAKNRVQAWSTHDKAILEKDTLELEKIIRQQIKGNNAQNAIIIVDEIPPSLFEDITSKRGTSDWLLDVLDTKGQSLRASLPGLLGFFRKPTPPARVLFAEKVFPTKGITVTEARSELVERLGEKATNALLTTGKVRLVEPVEAVKITGSSKFIPSREFPYRIKGFYREGISYLIPAGISKGRAWNVLMHELGVHHGYKKIFGEKFAREIFATFASKGREQNEFGRAVRKAHERVPSTTPPAHILEETLAYFVEESANTALPLHKKILARIRLWAVKTLGVRPSVFTEDDYVAIAASAVRRAAREAEEAPVVVREGVSREVFFAEEERENREIIVRIGWKRVPVFKNPTESQLNILRTSFKEKWPGALPGEPKIRTTRDRYGNTYSWMSDTIHSEVEGYLKDTYGIETDQNMEISEEGAGPPMRAIEEPGPMARPDIRYSIEEQQNLKSWADDLIKSAKDKGVVMDKAEPSPERLKETSMSILAGLDIQKLSTPARSFAEGMSPKGKGYGQFIEKWIASPEWYQHPVLKEIIGHSLDKSGRFHNLFNDFNAVDDPFAEHDTVAKTMEALARKGGISKAAFILGRTSADFKKLETLLDDADINGKKWTAEELKKAGYSEDVINAWSAVRESYDKQLDARLKPLKDLIARIKERATFEGKEPEYPDFGEYIIDGKKRRLNLKEATMFMGQLKGFYSPRIRDRGDWVITGKKEVSPGRDEFVRYNRRTKSFANLLRDDLAKEGFVDIGIEKTSRLPEETFQAIRMAEMGTVIGEAARKGLDKYDAEMQMAFMDDMVLAASDMIKSRGSRSMMIRRQRGPVVRGYITNPLVRFIRYTSNNAAGIAKAEMAEKMIKSLYGEYREGKKVGGLDAAKEADIHSLARAYVEEQLRNAETGDRMVGIAKGLTTLKFLGFNPRSVLVNITSLTTSVPVSLHTYVMKGKGSLARIGVVLSGGCKDYTKVMAGKRLANTDEMVFIDAFRDSGYTDAQYTRDAIGNVQGAYGTAWSRLMSGSMYVFGKSEEWVRGGTALAAYRLGRKQGLPHTEASERAVEATAKAHGTYGKETLPMVAWGKGVGRLGQAFYTYLKFPHNYLQMLYDTGVRKGNIKGVVFGLAAPAILGGVAATPMFETAIAICNVLLSLIDDDRDAEKLVYDTLNEYLGEEAEETIRGGLLGVLDIDITGSLSMGPGAIPTSLFELTGAVGGMVEDIGRGFGYAVTGEYARAAEAILPKAAANILTAIRELKGATTRRGDRIWDEEGNPYMPEISETIKKGFGFRSARRALLAQTTWVSKREERRFKETKSEINKKIKFEAAKLEGTDLETAVQAVLANPDITDKISEYNKNALRTANVPLMTPASITYQIRRMEVPTAKKRARAMRGERMATLEGDIWAGTLGVVERERMDRAQSEVKRLSDLGLLPYSREPSRTIDIGRGVEVVLDDDQYSRYILDTSRAIKNGVDEAVSRDEWGDWTDKKKVYVIRRIINRRRKRIRDRLKRALRRSRRR